jgi:glycosyltransferase involved in cell wall biosynthesis
MDRSKKSPELSLVLAFGDSEDSIGHTVRDAIRHLTALGKTFEIIAVNEGSRDNSLAVLQLLAERTPGAQLSVIHRDSSGRAYCRGAAEARGGALVLLRAHAGIGPLAPLGLALHRLNHGQDVVVVPGRFLVCRRDAASVAIARTRGASVDFERRFLRETERLSVLTLGAARETTLANPLLRLRELALGSLRKLSTNPVR